MTHALDEAWMGPNVQKWSEPQLTTAMDALAVPPAFFPATTPGTCLNQLDSMLLAFSEGMDQPMCLDVPDSLSLTQSETCAARPHLTPLSLHSGSHQPRGPWACPDASAQEMMGLWEAAALGQTPHSMPALPYLPPPAQLHALKHEALLASTSSASTHNLALSEAPAFTMGLRAAAGSPAAAAEETLVRHAGMQPNTPCILHA